jgi:hypothetical protein
MSGKALGGTLAAAIVAAAQVAFASTPRVGTTVSTDMAMDGNSYLNGPNNPVSVFNDSYYDEHAADATGQAATSARRAGAARRILERARDAFMVEPRQVCGRRLPATRRRRWREASWTLRGSGC